jgi:hypothetical protein
MRKIGKARLAAMAESLDGKLTADVRDEMIAEMSDIRDEILKLKTRLEDFHNGFRPLLSAAEPHFHYVDELSGISPSFLESLAAGQDESIELLEKVYAEIEGTGQPKLKQKMAEDEEAESTAATFQDSFFADRKKT